VERPRVVVTGIGCVSPFGVGVDRLRSGLTTGREVEKPRAWNSTGYRISAVYHADGVATNPLDQEYPFALTDIACDEAIDRSRLGEKVSTAGLAFASTSSGWHLPDVTLRGGNIVQRGAVDPLLLAKDGPAVRLCDRLGLSGPVSVISSACASSTGVIAWAVERLRSGEASAMLVGGVDVLTEVVYLGFHSMRLLGDATRPFARDRSGFVLAEGAAFLVLETAEHAAARHAVPLATVAGWGASADALHLTTPSATGIANSLDSALRDAGIRGDEIRAYHAHGTASAANDHAEFEALGLALGGLDCVRVTAIKSAIGHTEGVAGLFAAVTAVDAVVQSVLPPATPPRLADVDPPGVPLSAGPRENWPAEPAIVHASGFGGVNCSVVLTSPRGHAENSRRTVQPRRRVAIRFAAVANEDSVRTWGQVDDLSDRAAVAPIVPHWPKNPPADDACRLLANAIGAVLNRTDPTAIGAVRAGGLLTGTEHGSQEHHAAILDSARRAGPRVVDPMDFALSTFNVPAAMAGIAFQIVGQIETFVGATSGVEALASGASLIATGRSDGVLVGGHDTAKNRVWSFADDPDVNDLAVVLRLDTADDDTAGAVVSEVRRLPPTPSSGDLRGVVGAMRRVAESREAELWLDGRGFDPAEMNAYDDGAPSVRFLRSAPGAAAPLLVHLDAIAAVSSGEHRAIVVASTAPHSSTLVVRYERGHHA
jgi:nodulation protein E